MAKAERRRPWSSSRYLMTAGADANELVRSGISTNGARCPRVLVPGPDLLNGCDEIDLSALLSRTDLFIQILAEEDTHLDRTAYLLLRFRLVGLL